MNTSAVLSLPRTSLSNYTMSIEKNESLPGQQFENMHGSDYPVIHIDRKGRILYANKASFPLLAEWNCLASDFLPENLVQEHPLLLNPDAEFSINLETRYSTYFVDVIGFKESGYIGIYGFHTGIKKS